MILLYSSFLLLLGLIKHLVSLRARILERQYTRLAGAVNQQLQQLTFRPGNSNKSDPCQSAKQAFLLGSLVQQRDRVETRHFAWQYAVERLNRWVNTLRHWKGMKLPYSLGAVDVWMLLQLIDYLGVGQYLSATSLIQTMMSLFTS